MATLTRALAGTAEDVLVERLLDGDEEAFAELVTLHQGALVRLAALFVADGGAAEEVVQDTWLGVIKGLPTFERRASLKTWIFRILVNRARSRGARDGRFIAFSALEVDAEQTLADRFTAQGRWIQPPAMWHEQNPEDLLLRREVVGCLQASIAALPAGQRAVISLRDVEGLGAAEVCNILGITETNQRVLLHRARTKVRAALEKLCRRG